MLKGEGSSENFTGVLHEEYTLERYCTSRKPQLFATAKSVSIQVGVLIGSKKIY